MEAWLTASRAALALAAGLALTPLAGCGDSTSTSVATSTPMPTTAAGATTGASSSFAASVEAICAKRITAIARQTSQTIENEAKFRKIAHERASIERTALEEFAKLQSPARLEPDWRQFLAYRRTLIDSWEDISKRGLLEGVGKHAESRLQPIGKAEQDMIAAARRQGYKQCARQI